MIYWKYVWGFGSSFNKEIKYSVNSLHTAWIKCRYFNALRAAIRLKML